MDPKARRPRHGISRSASGRLREVAACLILTGLLAGLLVPWAARAEQEPSFLAPLKQEAERGLPAAQYSLGRHYILGRVLERNIPKGLQLLRKAAGKDYPPALLFLARVHERGLGVSRDFVQAKRWYEQAAEQGVEAAEIKLKPFEPGGSQEHELFGLVLDQATPFAVRAALQKQGGEPLELMDRLSCDTFASNGLLPGSDRIRACYTEAGRLAHLEFRFPPGSDGSNPTLGRVLASLRAKYGDPDRRERQGIPLEYSWSPLDVGLHLWMDHQTRTAFLRYEIKTRQERYLRELERHLDRQRPGIPEL